MQTFFSLQRISLSLYKKGKREKKEEESKEFPERQVK